MTMPQFTPGPWVVASDHGQVGSIETSDGVAVAQALQTLQRALDRPVREANAHLIAAAPELYEALEKCRQWMPAAADHHSADASVYDAMSSADAALAKARGES